MGKTENIIAWFTQFCEIRDWNFGYEFCNITCSKAIYRTTKFQTKYNSYEDDISRIALLSINEDDDIIQIGYSDECRLNFFTEYLKNHDLEVTMIMEGSCWKYNIYYRDEWIDERDCPLTESELMDIYDEIFNKM